MVAGQKFARAKPFSVYLGSFACLAHCWSFSAPSFFVTCFARSIHNDNDKFSLIIRFRSLFIFERCARMQFTALHQSCSESLMEPSIISCAEITFNSMLQIRLGSVDHAEMAERSIKSSIIWKRSRIMHFCIASLLFRTVLLKLFFKKLLRFGNSS